MHSSRYPLRSAGSRRRESGDAAGQGQLSGTGVDRDLEKNLAALASADSDIKSESADAVQYLRVRHDQPAVAGRLAAIMMTAPNSKARELAELALVGTADKQASDLLQFEHMVRELNTGDGKFGTGPANADQLMTDLKQVRDHPLVAARLIETITDGTCGAWFAATVLQGTTNEKILSRLNGLMEDLLDDVNVSRASRDQMSQLPWALKFSTDPKTQSLLIKAFREGEGGFHSNFRASAGRTLGAIKTKEARELLVDSVFDPYQDWSVRRAVCDSLKEQMDDGIKEKLIPLIKGPVSRTAWLIADRQSKSPLGQALKWANMMTSRKEPYYDIRVQAALVLQEEEPELAKAVYLDAFKGRRDSLKHRCQFFAARDAEAALKRLDPDTQPQ